MAAPSRSPDTGDIAGLTPSRTSTTSYPGMPRWVKVSGIVVLVLVLLVVGAMVVGGGQHGPMRHTPSGAPGAPGSDTLPAAQVVQQAQQA